MRLKPDVRLHLRRIKDRQGSIHNIQPTPTRYMIKGHQKTWVSDGSSQKSETIQSDRIESAPEQNQNTPWTFTQLQVEKRIRKSSVPDSFHDSLFLAKLRDSRSAAGNFDGTRLQDCLIRPSPAYPSVTEDFRLRMVTSLHHSFPSNRFCQTQFTILRFRTLRFLLIHISVSSSITRAHTQEVTFTIRASLTRQTLHTCWTPCERDDQRHRTQPQIVFLPPSLTIMTDMSLLWNAAHSTTTACQRGGIRHSRRADTQLALSVFARLFSRMPVAHAARPEAGQGLHGALTEANSECSTSMWA